MDRIGGVGEEDPAEEELFALKVDGAKRLYGLPRGEVFGCSSVYLLVCVGPLCVRGFHLEYFPEAH